MSSVYLGTDPVFLHSGSAPLGARGKPRAALEAPTTEHPLSHRKVAILHARCRFRPAASACCVCVDQCSTAGSPPKAVAVDVCEHAGWWELVSEPGLVCCSVARPRASTRCAGGSPQSISADDGGAVWCRLVSSRRDLLGPSACGPLRFCQPTVFASGMGLSTQVAVASAAGRTAAAPSRAK